MSFSKYEKLAELYFHEYDENSLIDPPQYVEIYDHHFDDPKIDEYEIKRFTD